MNKNFGNQGPHERADYTISIPTKITDGLFMADHHIAQDLQFFENNQVTHVINCAGKQIPNTRNVNEVSFLTFQWSQNNIQNITDQNVISVIVNFIQQCRRQHGCLLIHSHLSQSRPFCLLACYLMIKFKWNLFKTLEFLNSRKQDIQLQPAFFEQLTNFHQKLQQKGLIKSKSWIISEGMGEEEIILTNTYLNSKKRNILAENQRKKPLSKKGNISWKNDLIIEHSYCPNSIIAVNNPYLQSKKVNNTHPVRDRSDSAASKEQKQKKKEAKQTKSNNVLQQKTNSLGQMNVTKKWTELRQMWMKQKQYNKEKEDSKEKQNHNLQNCHNNSLNTDNKKQSIIAKKDNQRINDRLHEKLNLLKRYQQKSETQNPNKKSKKNLQNKENSIEDSFKPKQNENNNKIMSQKNSRVLHNNWIINKQVIKENINNQQPVYNNKQKTSNKSVIIVKPNHTGQINSDHGSRSSLRKATGSERKPEKEKQDASVGKFFKNQDILASKGRCNSTKPQRKQSPANGMGLIKNSSYKAKGKWKF